MGKQYCSVCARPKLGHARPFGKNCKMPPLPEDIRNKYLEEQRQLALQNRITEEDDGDVELTEDEEELEHDDLVAQEAEEKRLEALKLEILAKREMVKEQLARQKKAKEVNERIKKLKEEMVGLDQFLQDEIAEMKGIHDEITKPDLPLNLPGLSIQVLPQQTPVVKQPTPAASAVNLERQPSLDLQQQVSGQQPSAIERGPVGPTGIQPPPVEVRPNQETMSVHPPVQQYHGGARPKTAVIAAPPPGQPQQQQIQAALDPGLAAYSQAYNQARPPVPVPGVHQAPVVQQPTPAYLAQPGYPYGQQAVQQGMPAQDWLRSQPLLAAAAGLGSTAPPQAAAAATAAAPRPTDRRARKENRDLDNEGKCLPEQYIEKSALNDTDVKIPSYYDFMHGVFRMLDEKLNENGENINEYIIYYEQLSSYATHHKWSAVFSLHRSMCNEVERGMRSWSDEIKHRQTSKHLNSASDLSEMKQRKHEKESGAHGGGGSGAGATGGGAGGDRKGAKSHHGNQNFRPRVQSDISSLHTKVSPDAPICSLFNYNQKGCTFGQGRCGYRHECEICEGKGKVATHPAMYCHIVSNVQKSDGKQK